MAFRELIAPFSRLLSFHQAHGLVCECCLVIAQGPTDNFIK